MFLCFFLQSFICSFVFLLFPFFPSRFWFLVATQRKVEFKWLLPRSAEAGPSPCSPVRGWEETEGKGGVRGGERERTARGTRGSFIRTRRLGVVLHCSRRKIVPRLCCELQRPQSRRVAERRSQRTRERGSWSRRPLSQSETWSTGAGIKQGGAEDELREEKRRKTSFLSKSGPGKRCDSVLHSPTNTVLVYLTRRSNSRSYSWFSLLSCVTWSHLNRAADDRVVAAEPRPPR